MRYKFCYRSSQKKSLKFCIVCRQRAGLKMPKTQTGLAWHRGKSALAKEPAQKFGIRARAYRHKTGNSCSREAQFHHTNTRSAQHLVYTDVILNLSAIKRSHTSEAKPSYLLPPHFDYCQRKVDSRNCVLHRRYLSGARFRRAVGYDVFFFTGMDLL